jgi:Family of unknown function (DUF6412)
MWAGAWLLVTGPGDAPSLTSLTAVVAIALFAALASRALRRIAAMASGRGSDGGAKLAGSADLDPPVPRLSDPDAAGHPRPRAPAADPAA